jgi:organic hydroperoxide reductase OsmC/OhrA
VCAHARIAVRSYEDAPVATLARRDGKVRFVDVLLCPEVVLNTGSDIEKARALHERAHNICVVVNSVNFPVRHEAEVMFSDEGVAAA